MQKVTTLEETLKILKTIPAPLLIQAIIYKEADDMEIFSNISEEKAKKITKEITQNYLENMDITLLHNEIINDLWKAVEEPI